MMLSDSVDNFGFPIHTKDAENNEKILSSAHTDSVIIQEHKKLEREKEQNAAKILEEIESKLEKLTEKEKEKDEDLVSEQGIYDVILDEDSLEEFADGLLTVLSELEATKKIPPIENAYVARDALLEVVRQLFQKKNTLAKMSRKFARFGAKQFLKRQRALISKAI